MINNDMYILICYYLTENVKERINSVNKCMAGEITSLPTIVTMIIIMAHWSYRQSILQHNSAMERNKQQQYNYVFEEN